MDCHLPFKVGQEAESRSFEKGFRGAWFRCKINNIRTIKGHVEYALEYYDFPDEKIKFSKAYQNPMKVKASHKVNEMHLMVRPHFPTIFCESEMPSNLTLSEVVAIVKVWKVGDLVDWWTDGCYWSGTITHLLGEDKVKLKLPEPPVGEGMSYEASFKDLRPSLDWSLKHGWIVPISKECESTHSCVRLIRPINQLGAEKDDHCANVEAQREIDAACLDGSSDSSYSSVLKTSINSPNTEPTRVVPDLCENGAASLSPHASSSLGGQPAAEVLDFGHKGLNEGTSIGCKPGQPNEDASAKTMRATGRRDENNCLGAMASSFPDTIESAVLDLEELANRIKWLKRIHQFGLQSANAVVPSWKFLEKRVANGHR
ncbi:hypothetical protein Sjap_008324 [Stephania japonica]|uniref:Agenet domain-containing protein n=1 Tax=Stephania japonica TaxID=461633 RepID=A0AAP0JRJ6_9MAGN